MKFDLVVLLPFIVSGAILVGTAIVATVFSKLFNRFMLRNSEIVKSNPTNYRFIRHTVIALIYIIGFSWAVYHIPSLRTVASSLLAGAGILAVAIGFASQQALSNIISGIFVVIFKPYRINDRIIIKDTLQGIVEDITLRHTVIKDLENRRIVIPNSIISNDIIVNIDLNDMRVCRLLNIGISYDSDIELARKIIKEEALNHRFFIDQRTRQQIDEGMELVPVRLISYGQSSIDLRAWVWANNAPDGFVMHCELLENIKKRFDAEGVEIPFSYQTLVFKNKLAIENASTS